MPEVALLEARREVRNLGWGLGQHERLLRDEEALLLSEGRLISLIPPRSPGSAKPCPSNNWDTIQRPLISSKEFTVLELVVKVPVTTLLKQCKLIIKCKLWLKSQAELVYYKVKPTVLPYFKSNYSGMSFCSLFLFAVQEGQAATSFKFSSCWKNAEKMLKLCAIPIPDHHPYEMFTYILSWCSSQPTADWLKPAS